MAVYLDDKEVGTIVDMTKDVPPAYQIYAYDFTGTPITLKDGTDNVLGTKDTDEHGLAVFNVDSVGTYTVEGTQTKTIEVSEIGISRVSVSKSVWDAGWDEIHTACQGGYADKLWALKDKKQYVEIGSIFNNLYLFIEDFIKHDDGTVNIAWRFEGEARTSYNINPYFSFLKNADDIFSTSSNYTYSNKGGYKYSAMIQRCMEKGEEAYTQATAIKPDGGSQRYGIEFSNIKYSDTGLTSRVYTYDEATDTMTPDDEITYFASSTEAQKGEKFIKGYWKNLGKLTEEQFSQGTYYTYTSSSSTCYGYTPATEFDANATYYGLYETLQEDGIFLDGLKLIRQYLVKEKRKSSVGGQTTSGVVEHSEYVSLPAVEEITGTNRDTTLFSRKKGTTINSYNVPDEGTKKPCYDDFQMQATGGPYWTRSSYSGSSYSFCCINYSGSIDYYSVFSTNGVRLGFITK